MANIEEVRELAESDLYTFACLVTPERVYGEVHKDVFKFLQNCETPNQLLLLPRAHMKSHCIAVWCAWYVTVNPETSILYVSATTTLAEAQLYAIKNILTSPVYQMYWPEMIHPDEGKREKWSTGAIAVDHPKRKAEGIRDMTIVAAGLSTNTTGLHAEVIVPDDVVVPDNAYTEEGRRKCAASMSQMASILNTGGIVKACGTRYHPADQYSIWKDQQVPIYDDDGQIIGEEPIWDIKEEVVEINGKFLWPRTARSDGKLFGFDRKELARISAMYSDRTQFYAQYYNDPNDPESQRLTNDRFQYYDKKHLKQSGGQWYYKEDKLNVYAAIDFAYTLGAKADYTAIVVIGINPDNEIYILDIDRFKTDKIADYYSHVMDMHQRWEFKKLRAEVTAAQSIIVRDLKDKFRTNGSMIRVDEHKPTRHQGSKEERIAAVLEPRYAELQIWHYKGGYIPVLEEELMLARPKHDDVKDCLASAVEIAVAPKQRTRERDVQNNAHRFNSRFGGVRYR
jgi:phage terminase large subunit-like protein